ncbi:MAG: putative toxin-antitoxin system toxin component, PIN family [Acidobacteria bacterium]|nr:putative toxin-antitoxin system toxin component, PIN family [Acidobacteriota bacterium]
MSRLRIVLDTNVLISAALKPLGPQALVVNLVAFRAIELFVSAAVLAEYREVSSRPKFAQIPPAAVATLLDLIEGQATMVKPTRCLTISNHDSDNRFYECADAGGADYIVTGNSRHFTKPHKNTRIITGRQLLELLKAVPQVLK